jgi:hypothetical protein
MNLLKQEKPFTSKRNLPLLRIKEVVALTEQFHKAAGYQAYTSVK